MDMKLIVIFVWISFSCVTLVAANESFRDTNYDIYQEMLDNIKWLRPGLTADYLMDNNVTEECSQEFEQYMEALTNRLKYRLWAFQMADSTGKFESGVIFQNAIFEGRYIMCSEADEDWDDVVYAPITPMYCLTRWTAVYPRFFRPYQNKQNWEPSVNWENFENLLDYEENFDFSKPGLNSDDYSLVRVYRRGLGICIPSPCTNEDAHILLRTVYQPEIQGFSRVRIHCERNDDMANDTEAIITIVILALFGALVLTSSCYHAHIIRRNHKHTKTSKHKYQIPSEDSYAYYRFEHLSEPQIEESQIEHDSVLELSVIELEEQEGSKSKESLRVSKDKEKQANDIDTKSDDSSQLLLCFSLYQNLPKILNFEQVPSAFNCINGIRAVAMGAIIFGHTYVLMADVSSNLFGWPTFVRYVYGKMVTLGVYCDTFLILSAFFATTSLLSKLQQKDGKFKATDILKLYLLRYLRLTPMYAIVLMIYTNLGHYFIEGPFSQDYFQDVDSCSTEWWKNLLYVNNLDIFITKDKSCMGWSWFLAVEMQLYIVTPLYIYLLYKWPKVGVTAVALSFTGGMIANTVLWDKFYTQSGREVVEDFTDAMLEIYIKPWTRCPVYFMGMLLGFVFYCAKGQRIKIPKVVVVLGWLIAISMIVIVDYLPAWFDCLFATFIVKCDWSSPKRVAWNVLYRPAWGIWVCWVIFACSNGYGGIVNSFLSWNMFVPLSKLAYVTYLIHHVVVLAFNYSAPVQMYFTYIIVGYNFFGNYVISYLCSTILAAAVAQPLYNLGSFISNFYSKRQSSWVVSH